MKFFYQVAFKRNLRFFFKLHKFEACFFKAHMRVKREGKGICAACAGISTKCEHTHVHDYYTWNLYTYICSRDPLHTSLAQEQKADYLGHVLRCATCVTLDERISRPLHPRPAIRSVESEAVCQIFSRSETSVPIATSSRRECPWELQGHYKTSMFAVRKPRYRDR